MKPYGIEMKAKLKIMKDLFRNTHIILLGASPEVDAACVAGDVEHSQALQTRQRHGNTVTLKRDGGGGGG